MPKIDSISTIMIFFSKAIGLILNLSKTVVFLVRCASINLQDILDDFASRIVGFPGSYLGIPLHF